jgi:hypothetical protein
MTLFGKILLFTNLVLSLGMATFALGIYENYINWPVEALGPNREVNPGIKQQVQEKQDSAKVASVRLDGAWSSLKEVEAQRPANQVWYAEQLAILEGKDSKGQKVDAPIKRLVLKGGKSEVDPKTDRPALEAQPDPRLKSRRAFLEALAENERLIQAKLADIDKIVNQEKELTVEINGDKGMGNQPGKKGFRDLLAEEQKAFEKAKAELEYLRPFRYNRMVELSLLQKRQQQLKARQKELEGQGVAALELGRKGV